MKEVLESLMVEGSKVLVSSLDVAKFFNKEHKNVIQAIRNLIEQKTELGLRNFSQSSYTNEQNKKQPCYLMDKCGFHVLASGMTGEKGIEYRLLVFELGQAMEARIKELEAQLFDDNLAALRLKVYGEHRDIVDTRKDFVRAVNEKVIIITRGDFGRATNLTYSELYGLIASEIAELFGVKQSDNIRDYMCPKTLKALKMAEQMVTNLLSLKDNKISMKDLDKIIKNTAAIIKEESETNNGYITPNRISDKEVKEKKQAIRTVKKSKALSINKAAQPSLF